MLSNTYTELVEDVKDWLDREDIPDAVFKRGVAHAESKVNELLKTPAQEVVADGNTDIEGRISVPTNFLFLKRFSVIGPQGHEYPLRHASYKEYTRLRDNTEYNVPQVFYRENGEFLVAPKGSFVVKLVFYQEVPTILGSEGTNWLIKLAPDLYFNALMFSGYEYILDEEKAQYWNEKFKKAVARVQNLAERTDWEGSHLVISSPQ